MLQRLVEERRPAGPANQPAPEEAADARTAVPAPRGTEKSTPVDPETLTFVDIEHVEVEQAELDALAASLDGFI